MTKSEKIAASITAFVSINTIVHYCALAGGAEWGTFDMGAAAWFANIIIAFIVAAIWTRDWD